jgi:hypothetical protein
MVYQARKAYRTKYIKVRGGLLSNHSCLYQGNRISIRKQPLDHTYLKNSQVVGNDVSLGYVCRETAINKFK